VILPKKNEQDLSEIEDVVKSGLKFIFAENIDQVLDVALTECGEEADAEGKTRQENKDNSA